MYFLTSCDLICGTWVDGVAGMRVKSVSGVGMHVGLREITVFNYKIENG